MFCLLCQNTYLVENKQQWKLEATVYEKKRCLHEAGFDYSVDNESLETLYWLKWGFVIEITVARSQAMFIVENVRKMPNWTGLLNFKFW